MASQPPVQDFLQSIVLRRIEHAEVSTRRLELSTYPGPDTVTKPWSQGVTPSHQSLAELGRYAKVRELDEAGLGGEDIRPLVGFGRRQETALWRSLLLTA